MQALHNSEALTLAVSTLGSYELWHRYCDVFKKLWGIDYPTCCLLGVYGKEIGQAEFAANGDAYYRYSISAPIRNALYMTAVMPIRWTTMKRFVDNKFPLPILDYGCGVGYGLLWMKQELGLKGEDLYALDLPGNQHDVADEVFVEEGIRWVEEVAGHYGTIICLNVLEHLPHPLATARHLADHCDVLIANCDHTPGGDHIAAADELTQVTKYLEDRHSFLR